MTWSQPVRIGAAMMTACRPRPRPRLHPTPLVTAREEIEGDEETLRRAVRKIVMSVGPMLVHGVRQEDLGEAAKLRRRGHPVLTGVGRRRPEGLHKKKDKRSEKSNPLDSVLDVEDWDPMKSDRRLEELRKSLEEKKHQREEATRRRPVQCWREGCKMAQKLPKRGRIRGKTRWFRS